MNELAKQWVAALRSGEYEQTKMSLRNEKGYCCLGVACEVAIKSGLRLTVAKEDWSDEYSYDGMIGTLPDKVRAAMDMRCPDGYAIDLETSLTTLNDRDGLDFYQIADYIETNADKIFYRDDGVIGMPWEGNDEIA